MRFVLHATLQSFWLEHLSESQSLLLKYLLHSHPLTSNIYYVRLSCAALCKPSRFAAAGGCSKLWVAVVIKFIWSLIFSKADAFAEWRALSIKSEIHYSARLWWMMDGGPHGTGAGDMSFLQSIWSHQSWTVGFQYYCILTCSILACGSPSVHRDVAIWFFLQWWSVPPMKLLTRRSRRSRLSVEEFRCLLLLSRCQFDNCNIIL